MAKAVSSPSGQLNTYVFRLPPHTLLKEAIIAFAKTHRIKAGVILTAVGSLEQYSIRFANQEEVNTVGGHFEIVSLTGTFSDSSAHIHISVSDSKGQTIGGHLMNDNRVYTTVEIAVGEVKGIAFAREKDDTYGYPELVILKKQQRRKK